MALAHALAVAGSSSLGATVSVITGGTLTFNGAVGRCTRTLALSSGTASLNGATSLATLTQSGGRWTGGDGAG